MKANILIKIHIEVVVFIGSTAPAQRKVLQNIGNVVHLFLASFACLFLFFPLILQAFVFGLIA